MASARQGTERVRQTQEVDAIPTLAWSARPDGSAEFFNRRWLDYTGLSAEALFGVSTQDFFNFIQRDPSLLAGIPTLSRVGGLGRWTEKLSRRSG